MPFQPPKIPACERCRIRKVKCDGNPPKCTGCTRSNSACIIVDVGTQERFSRDSIHQLERRLEHLESITHQLPGEATRDNPTTPGLSRHGSSHFVGDGSGLGLLRQISMDANTASLSHARLHEGITSTPYTIETVAAHMLPSLELANTLVERHFNHMHLHHPLLARFLVEEMLQRVYGKSLLPASSEDYYRLFMIFAISSVTMFRRGEIQEHPYGYFRAAQQYAPEVSIIGSISAIQNLLLIARFAMYYHIDCSIWDIARLCMRQCVELGLHRRPASSLPPVEEQIRRNVFWDCYIHDRYSSGILGRPFAIAEDDIETLLPIDADEEDLVNSTAASLDEVDMDSFTKPNKASVFRFVVELRRLTTRVSNAFFSSSDQRSMSRTMADAGRVKLDLDRFLVEMQLIRDAAPVFYDPKSLYQRPQWYDFMVEKDRLTLIRGALARLPKDNFHPPRWMLRTYLQSAVNVIELYTSMFAKGHITWTRSYLQILFTTGLAIIYSLSLLRPNEARPGFDTESDFGRELRALMSASELMQRFVSEMPDAGQFVQVFDVLVKQYTGTRARPSRNATPPIAVDNTAPQESNLHVGQGPRVHKAAVFDVVNAPEEHGVDLTNNSALPTYEWGQTYSHNQDYGIDFDFDLDDPQNYFSFTGDNNNLLGQMAAGVGEYAWAIPPSEALWSDYGMFRGQ
ncbi:hypothetical protein PV08_00393 [Exophiala spinifera]|uniref:Zn(2)-C6 fungal-type domain-containing protein n=1 Tax=Exophiala spinifera TaxID=91928 RepID=A0A0D2BLJ3_9EURO|nr:uncharacterized protein PV08_00393 [Exophiala spinifera]KIW19818.1 hypothetical protein PV08_00393 [Exophiala spinifera]